MASQTSGWPFSASVAVRFWLVPRSLPQPNRPPIELKEQRFPAFQSLLQSRLSRPGWKRGLRLRTAEIA